MKKFLIISGVVLAGLIFAIILLSKSSKVVIVDQNELDAKFKNGETFVMVIGLTTCRNCINYKNNTLKKYSYQDDSLPVYMLYSDESFGTQTEAETFYIQHGITHFENVPTTFLVENGQVKGSYVEGNIPLTQLESFITERLT